MAALPIHSIQSRIQHFFKNVLDPDQASETRNAIFALKISNIVFGTYVPYMIIFLTILNF
jgi:hypothetical protein